MLWSTSDQARLFFGFDIQASWPKELPQGKLIQEKARHLTLLFLGPQRRQPIIDLCEHIPKPPFSIGPVGIFDQCLFFPKRHAHCVAWQVTWPAKHNSYLEYRQTLENFFTKKMLIKKEKRPHVPHVTICRKPFDKLAWLESFQYGVLKTTQLHLYESLGNSTYHSLWTYPLLEAFVKIEQTATMTFSIRGNSLLDLYQSAALALAFSYAPITRFFSNNLLICGLDDIIINLNVLINNTERVIGCPFKAVSNHGTIKEAANNTLEWEMIVDV